jgi:hypothetical protein
VYIHSLVNIRKAANEEATRTNDELHNELLYEHIGHFEATHRSIFQDVENFNTIIRSLSEAIANKQKLSRKRLEMLLAEMHMLQLVNCAISLKKSVNNNM